MRYATHSLRADPQAAPSSDTPTPEDNGGLRLAALAAPVPAPGADAQAQPRRLTTAELDLLA